MSHIKALRINIRFVSFVGTTFWYKIPGRFIHVDNDFLQVVCINELSYTKINGKYQDTSNQYFPSMGIYFPNIRIGFKSENMSLCHTLRL